MFTILRIIEFVLRLVERRLSQLDAGQREAMDAKFREALAKGDFDYASFLLQHRVWDAKKIGSNSVKK